MFSADTPQAASKHVCFIHARDMSANRLCMATGASYEEERNTPYTAPGDCLSYEQYERGFKSRAGEGLPTSDQQRTPKLVREGRRHGVRLPQCAHGLERTFRAHAKKDPAARSYVARRKNRFTSKTQFQRLRFIRRNRQGGRLEGVGPQDPREGQSRHVFIARDLATDRRRGEFRLEHRERTRANERYIRHARVPTSSSHE